MIDLQKGQHIFYRNNNYIDDIEFVVLDKFVLDKYVQYYDCISAKPLKDRMSFDDHGNNDWNTSSLKKYLNEEYIKRFDKKCLRETDGCNLFLLSIAEVRRYKDILPKCSTFWWTRSADVSDAFSAYGVYPSGQLGGYSAIFEQGVVPACIFNLTNMEFSIEDGNVVLTSKN